jgi:hypothetical protein
LKPKGLITITNLLGKKVGTVPFPEKNVLPGATRKIEAAWDQKQLWGIKYTATITGNYGVSNAQFSPETFTFWVFPWKAGLIIFFVIILLFFARRRIMIAVRILVKGR